MRERVGDQSKAEIVFLKYSLICIIACSNFLDTGSTDTFVVPEQTCEICA